MKINMMKGKLVKSNGFFLWKHWMVLLAIFSSVNVMYSQEVTQFRGKDAKGVYASTGLLTTWPEVGPPLLWEYEGLGNGYGSPVVTQNRIYVNGEIDSVSYLFALNLNGELIWKQKIGAEWVASFPGARSAPTVVDNLVYVGAGMGDVVCVETDQGEELWRVNLVDEYGGVLNRFGYSESLIAHEEMLFCMPGGPEYNVIALNRFTGELIWASEAVGEMPAFCTPLILEFEERTLYVSFSERHLLGIDVRNGELLWSHEQQGTGDVHVNTPWYDEPYLYYVAGNGNGTVKLEMMAGGTKIKEVWSTMRLDNLMGGFVLVGDYLVASGERKRFWYSLNVDNAEIVDSIRFDKGVTFMADDLLYMYNTRGQVGLFSMEEGLFEKRGELKVTAGTGEHFSHPIISDGILYVRRGNALMAYDLRE
jgi:outer membrane protein assembly factor BamB